MLQYCKIYDTRKCTYPIKDAINAGIRRGDLIQTGEECFIIYDGTDVLNIDFSESDGTIPKEITVNSVPDVHAHYWRYATRVTLSAKQSENIVSDELEDTPFKDGYCFVDLDTENIDNANKGFVILDGIRHETDTIGFQYQTGLHIMSCPDDGLNWSIL